MLEGILLVDKPAGWTSFDVVNYVRGMIARIEGKKPRNVKVGHTGTLDPAATGLLVLCIGKATKQVEQLMKQDKTYEVEICLGKTSSTGDKEGVITDVSTETPTNEAVVAAVQHFQGTVEQVPPAFSAIKVDGKRAYVLARAGREVVLKARTITIYRNEDIVYEYPYVQWSSTVSSGTYIRVLAEDIGKRLGCGAYMSNLRRTKIGAFDIGAAMPVKELTAEQLQKLLAPTE